MPAGYLCLVLHAHLPYVRHPEYEDFLEEDWLYEAITETYIPLLEMMDRLDRDGVDWRLTMSVTPTLAGMLADPLLQYRYVRHLDNLISLCTKELERTRWQPDYFPLAQMYMALFTRSREVFVNQYGNNLLAGFRRFLETGRLELITCCATHGFLPLMPNQDAARVQIELGAREFERHFGRRPRGIWLAECGYREGVDELLRDSGIQYFFTDTHGVLFANPRPRFGVYAPILCPASGVAALARDIESSRQVWSSIEGYPGHPNYREFYRDVGFDLDFEYLKPHLHEIGIRSNLGIKYQRITGDVDLADKQPYDPDAARRTAAEHAGHFMFNREKQVEWLASVMGDRPPLVVAPYDAELFGHWWFEGPLWLEFLFRKICYDQATIKTITVPEYLALSPKLQVCQPSLSSWGARGYCEVWLEETNEWIYPHLHVAQERMTELADRFTAPGELEHRALRQAGRELLLAQASDWPFILRTGTSPGYARKRVKDHLLRFIALHEQLTTTRVDQKRLGHNESMDNLFPDVDYRYWATRK